MSSFDIQYKSLAQQVLDDQEQEFLELIERYESDDFGRYAMENDNVCKEIEVIYVH